jgi:thymidine kinase
MQNVDKSGIIEVIAGSMYSGKTEELIRRLKRAKYAKIPFQVFKPIVDNRYDKNDIVSHEGFKIEAIAIDRPKHILHLLKEETEIIGIDEAQFFNKEILEVVNELANIQKRIIIAGLDLDCFGKTFGQMGELLALADIVTKPQAICVICGDNASKTYRIDDNKEQISVGSFGKYEARCRKCHDKLNISKVL